MSNNVFPKDGSVDLAVENLVNAIVENKLDEKEIDYLSTKFRYSFPQKEKYGNATKITTENFMPETMKECFEKGFKNDPDLLLDMQHSGQLVSVPISYYTNYIDMGKYADEQLDLVLKEGYAPSEARIYFPDPQIFYHKLLGSKLYNSEKSAALHDVEDDFDLATKEFLKILDNEKDGVKEQLLSDFREKVSESYSNDSLLYQELQDDQYADAQESLMSIGFLKEKETYLILASNINWQNDSSWNLIDVEKLDDIIKQVAPNSDDTIDLTRKENTPYFEAMVYFHGVPMGSHVYILPESQWDKLEGYDKETGAYGQKYSFLEEAINNNSDIKEIFHSRAMLRELEKEAENNPVAAKIKEVYDKYLYNYGGTTAENSKNYTNEDAWQKVSEFLADNVVTSSKMTLKDKENYNKCEVLLTKFNPTLRPADEIIKDFKSDCQKMIEYHEHREAKAKQKQR